jgi:hypothetical protein
MIMNKEEERHNFLATDMQERMLHKTQVSFGRPRDAGKDGTNGDSYNAANKSNFQRSRQEHREPPSCASPPDGVRLRVFYVSETQSGGSRKYIGDLIKHYSSYGIEFHGLSSKVAALQASDNFRENDIILFQYLLYTDFTFDDILNLVETYRLRLVVAIHDRYFLFNDSGLEYEYDPIIHSVNEENQIDAKKRSFLQKAEHIIFPSPYIYDVFRRVIDLKSMVVVPHIDQRLYRRTFIPALKRNINIGIITEATYCKGLNLLEQLFRRWGRKGKNRVNFFVYSKYDKKARPNVMVRGEYMENDIYRKLERDHVHGLLFLNNYPETYCYALTKGINSGLPFLYTNKGAIANRVTMENKTAKYIATDNTDLMSKFDALLNFIREHAGRGEKGKLLSVLENQNLVEIPQFYDSLFFESTSSVMDCVQENYDRFVKRFAQVHRSIQPYAIYFPQFHPIPENNINFYEGYTDMTNLVAAKLEDPRLLTPLKNVLGFYDLVENKGIIPRQIELAKSYGMAGFAIYYYWFSDNSISHKHMVFQEVIDRFFETALEGFSVFFVYCNEAWTKNVAFGTHQGGYTIANNYTEENIKANMHNLVKYFRHPNYRKIRNRPLFFLHHPHEMTDAEIRLLKEVGDTVTQENGFDGIELVMDSRGEMYTGFPGYYLHANYKSPKAIAFMNVSTRPQHIDYETYVRQFLPDEEKVGDNSSTINSVFTNFDNTVRFYAHDEHRHFEGVGNKAMFTTRTEKRSVALFKEFLDVQFAKYPLKSGPTSKIFLINAWNEWGEQMTMEPSNEEGFAYLEAFQERLLLTPLLDDRLDNAPKKKGIKESGEDRGGGSE